MPEPFTSTLAGWILQRIGGSLAKTAWKKTARSIGGTPAEHEIERALRAALVAASSDALGTESGSSDVQRLVEVLLAADVPDMPEISPDLSILSALEFALCRHIETLRIPVAGLPDDYVATSPLTALESELGIEIDDGSLRAEWLRHFVALVYANRLANGPLAWLAVHLDAERATLERASLQVGIDRLALPPATSAEDVLEPIDHDRAWRIQVRSVNERDLARNPLVPDRLIDQVLSDGASIADLAERGMSRLIVGAAGSGKSVALKVAAIQLAVSEGRLPVPVHCLDVACELPPTFRVADVADAIVAAAVPPSLEHLTPFVRRALLEGRAVLFADGMDEIPQHADGPLWIARFRAALALWLEEAEGVAMIATRVTDHAPTTLGELELADFAALSDEQIMALLDTWLDDRDASETLCKRLRLTGADIVPLFVTLTAVAALSPDDTGELRVPRLVPRIAKEICRGAWRADGRVHSPREVDDLLRTAAQAAWQLGDGGRVERFSHNDLVTALGNDRDAAAWLEEESGLILVDGTSLSFIHPMLSDHLRAMHLARLGPDHVRSVIYERWWKHDVKWLINDLARLEKDPTSQLRQALEFAAARPEFDRGAELVGAVADGALLDLRDARWRTARDVCYRVCAARPDVASNHMPVWNQYVRDAMAALQALDIEEDERWTDAEMEPLVEGVLTEWTGDLPPPATSHALDEVQFWVRWRRSPGFLPPIEDSLAPYLSVAMKRGELVEDEMITIWKDSGRVEPYKREAHASGLGWVFCRRRPTKCDLSATGACKGMFTNRYTNNFYVPSEHRCAWVVALSEDAPLVSGYLTADDFAAIASQARDFGSAASRAVVFLAQQYPDAWPAVFEEWWHATDVTDAQRRRVISWLQRVFHEDSVGVAISGAPDLIRSESFRRLGDYPPSRPSLLSGLAI